MKQPSITVEWPALTGTCKAELKGRPAWALLELEKAGKRGVTPIDNPAPRWSGYIHRLREMGFDIVTHHEAHGGPFAGTHARYELTSSVRFLGGL